MPKIAAKGVIVKSASTATPTTAIPGIKSVSTNIAKLDMIDVTAHDSTAKEYLPSGVADTPELEMELFWDPTNARHDEIVDAMIARTLWYLTVVFPDGGAAELVLSGYFTNVSQPSADPETGALMVSVSFKAIAAGTYTQ